MAFDKGDEIGNLVNELFLVRGALMLVEKVGNGEAGEEGEGVDGGEDAGEVVDEFGWD